MKLTQIEASQFDLIGGQDLATRRNLLGPTQVARGDAKG
jgi:hypothetical protein